MEPRCSLCRHPRRAEIDQRILQAQVGVRGNSLANVANYFNVSYQTLRRHTAHVGPQIVDFKEDEVVKEAIDTARGRVVEQVTEAERFVEDFQMLRDKAMKLLGEAEEDAASGDKKRMAGSFDRRLKVLREIRNQTDLRSRVVLQILEMGKDNDISREDLDEFLGVLRTALEDYPEVMDKVMFAMKKVAG
jgi:hypothetical protein